MSWKPEEGIVGESPVMRALSARIDRVASSNLPVLVTGDTGTGKELVARVIHARSNRRRGPFISENCASLADTLLESELFGHESGAFTGARKRSDGLFRRANGGTLFIDEIGDMSPAMQVKLLRVLQEGEVRRIGGDHTDVVDVRVIVATHKNLEDLVRRGRFRQDLLFRLAVLEVTVSPLRERASDIPSLVQYFLNRLAREERRPPRILSAEALDRLLDYDWPGNVRELENAVRVAALFSGGGILEAHAFPLHSHPSARSEPTTVEDRVLSYKELLSRLESRERSYIRHTLGSSKGNKAEAARRLGITRYALYRTMKRLGVDPEGERSERELATSSA